MTSTTSFPPSSPTSTIRRIFGAHPLHTDAELHALAFTPGGTLWSVEDTGVLRHWDLSSRQQISSHHLEELATLWCFGPDATLVAAGSDDLTVWNVANGDELMCLSQPDWVTALAFHPRRNLVATGHDDSRVRVWDLKRQKKVQEFRGHTLAVSALAFSADGKYLASAGRRSSRHSALGSRTGRAGRLSTGTYGSSVGVGMASGR